MSAKRRQIQRGGSGSKQVRIRVSSTREKSGSSGGKDRSESCGPGDRSRGGGSKKNESESVVEEVVVAAPEREAEEAAAERRRHTRERS